MADNPDLTINGAEARGIDASFCKRDAPRAFGVLLRYLPVSLAVREIMRMRALADAGTLLMPLLDVGCGDGLFWEVLTNDLAAGKSSGLRGLVGVDISDSELQLASLRLSSQGGEVLSFDISHDSGERRLDTHLGPFKTVVANSSLEHVPKLEVALRNIRRYMARDSTLWLFLPAPQWSNTLAMKRLLRKISPRISGMYGGMWDGFYQHYHLYPAWMWAHMLNGLGFSFTIRGVGNAHGNRIFERWLPAAFVSFTYKSIFGHYPAGSVSWFKQMMLPGMTPFLNDVQSGAVVLDDLEHPEVVEYVIRCSPR